MVENKRKLRKNKEINYFKSARFKIQHNISKHITLALKVTAVITLNTNPVGCAV